MAVAQPKSDQIGAEFKSTYLILLYFLLLFPSCACDPLSRSDLKPANIMLTMENQIKLGDLGLGRYFTSQTLEAFSKVGTPLYMSAEVLQGSGYTFSADIWSLGCVLYELCMLKSPFKSDKVHISLSRTQKNLSAPIAHLMHRIAGICAPFVHLIFAKRRP